MLRRLDSIQKSFFPKDVWQIIAHELAVDPTGFHVLLTLRLTHPYFKEITNEIPGFSRQLPINATKFLNTKLLPEHAEVALYAQRILEEALKSHQIVTFLGLCAKSFSRGLRTFGHCGMGRVCRRLWLRPSLPKLIFP